MRHAPAEGAPLSATVLVPARNEKGNIEPLVRRLPDFSPDIEILFVEGHSQDGTAEEIERVIAAYPDRDIKLLVQGGQGQGRCRAQGLRRGAGRRAHDPRRRYDRPA